MAFALTIKCERHKKILAIGECAEHDGKVYGLVAPGFEQASVAAASLANEAGHYRGSIAASKLKVAGTPVFSVGPFSTREPAFFGASFVYRDATKQIYRKLLIRGLRLHGALGIGSWSETSRVQSLVGTGERVYPWQIVRFVHTGQLWAEDQSSDVKSWPSSATVCQCAGIRS